MSSSILASLERAGARPPDGASQSDKIQYAVRLSDALAIQLANSLRPTFPGILPSGDGSGLESVVASAAGSKRLDVNYSTLEHGLGLGVSLKTISHRDPSSNRYTHNMKRVDEELLAEAIDYHVRQPYAVLVALYFLPVDGCSDGKAGSSSFGSWVKKLYSRAGRDEPDGRAELFERIFIGLYKPHEPGRGDVSFFDVRSPPPKNAIPPEDQLLDWNGLVQEIRIQYESRNGRPFQWADDQ